MGSLRAALDRLDVRYELSADPSALRAASAAIFPGDGAFGATMTALRERGLDTAIADLIGAGRPFLGICVGMQVLYEGSTEFGASQGLGVLPGVVRPFERAPRVPHMGWNTLHVQGDHPFVRGIGPGDYAYFLHSYRVEPNAVTAAATEYGERFTSIAARENVMGTQFHPEKSAATGARLLRNFIELL